MRLIRSCCACQCTRRVIAPFDCPRLSFVLNNQHWYSLPSRCMGSMRAPRVIESGRGIFNIINSILELILQSDLSQNCKFNSIILYTIWDRVKRA